MRKKSRYKRKRGGSIFTKKICIDAPKNEADEFLLGNYKVSKQDLDHIIKTEKKPGYHIFRRTFSRRKGVCLTQEEFEKKFVKAGPAYELSKYVNEDTKNAYKKKLEEYENLKGQPEPKNEEVKGPVEVEDETQKKQGNKPLFQSDMGENHLFTEKSIQETHPELFKGGKKKSKAFKRHV